MFLAFMPVTYCNIFITIILRFTYGFFKFFYYYFVMFSFCYCFVLFISPFFWGGGIYLISFCFWFFFFWLLFAFFLHFFLLLYLLFINNLFVRCYIFFSFCFLFLFSTIQRRRWKCQSRFLQNNQTSHMMIYIFFFMIWISK